MPEATEHAIVPALSAESRTLATQAVQAMLRGEPDDRLEAMIAWFDTPEKIEALEAEMLKYEQADMPVKHYFSSGVCLREITMRRGIFAIGGSHRHDCLNIVLKGSASVLVDGKVKRITGPCVFTGKAMDRKVGYIHEDCVWLTAHVLDEMEPEKIVDALCVLTDTYKAHRELVKAGQFAPKILPPPVSPPALDKPAAPGVYIVGEGSIPEAGAFLDVRSVLTGKLNADVYLGAVWMCPLGLALKGAVIYNTEHLHDQSPVWPAGTLATGEWEVTCYDNGVSPVIRFRYNDAGTVKTVDVGPLV